MPRILRTRSCDADLFDIAAHIGEDNPRAADALIDIFNRKFLLRAEFPTMGANGRSWERESAACRSATTWFSIALLTMASS